jgi:transposase InsO family protein
MTVPTPSPDPANRLPRSPCQDLPDTPAQPPPGSLPQPPADPPAADATGQPTSEEQTSDRPRLQQPVRGRRLARKADAPLSPLTPEQRLLVLDAWRRSGLPAGDFAPLVGISKHTLYAWKHKFDTQGPAGLVDAPRGGPAGSRLPEATRRAILMLKEANPDWGCERIAALLLRGPALAASPQAVARVLREAGYELLESPTRPHPDHPRSFERARPNQLWQTDLFSFVLKRQNRRVFLVAFMDDHSRFLVGYGLHASQSAALVLEVFRVALDSYGAPQEVLTDNGSQYVTWRGKSAFTKELEKRGVGQVVASPRHPQTLGKIERFWGTLWRECVETAIFLDLSDARRRIGLFIDHYNFQRPHQGIGGLVPADRFFGAAPEVLRTLKARVAGNALDLARQGVPKAPFYLTGQVGGQPFSLHAEGERVILTGASGTRREIDLTVPAAPAAPAAPAGSELPDRLVELPEPICPQGIVTGHPGDAEEPGGPGTSPLDGGLDRLAQALRPPQEGGKP